MYLILYIYTYIYIFIWPQPRSIMQNTSVPIFVLGHFGTQSNSNPILRTPITDSPNKS
jgi:hypothetical protein